MEAAWPSWREERKTGISWVRPPQVRLWDRSSLRLQFLREPRAV